MNPRPSTRLMNIPAKGEACLSLDDVDDHGHGRCMLRKLLASVKSEDYRFHLIVSINRTAQYPILRYLDESRKVLDVFVC